MPLEQPSVIANAIMAHLYDILTNGDDTVPVSEDNFFSWCTPGIPIREEDFDFLTQGLTGVLRKAAVDVATNNGSSTNDGSTNTGSTQLTPEQINQLLGQDTSRLYNQTE